MTAPADIDHGAALARALCGLGAIVGGFFPG
jgi:hypothetical protein